MDDCINTADMAEKLVAEPFTGAGALDQSGDSWSMRGSGTCTMPTFGSMVQKG
jgi:uncharacterized membrane protein